MKPIFNVKDEEIVGVIVANMSNWRDVYGNCSIKLQVAKDNDAPVPTSYQTIYKKSFANVNNLILTCFF